MNLFYLLFLVFLLVDMEMKIKLKKEIFVHLINQKNVLNTICTSWSKRGRVRQMHVFCSVIVLPHGFVQSAGMIRGSALQSQLIWALNKSSP